MIILTRVLRAPLEFPIGFLQTLCRSISDFTESVRLGIEVASEIDESNQLTARGRALLGINENNLS